MNQASRIDVELMKQAEKLSKYWRSILKRILSIIKFLYKRGLAFRGDNKLLGLSGNGNYLGLLELIAEYDDFLKHHIQVHGNQGSGHTNYLSSTICEEFIQLLSDRVFQEIVLRIKKLRYYSISLDSTSDKSHVDQLTLIFRYIENVKPVERFVKFMPNQGHKAQDMFNCVMRFLEDHEIDVKNCRG
ncbi:uncharacterized protein [Linepithema humile]|uniref:uncharacterized protein n=1 Tax=Linepithema humile TaxID=83485 RepID=UPI00351DEAC9